MSPSSPMLGRPANDRSRNAGARPHDAVGDRAARAQPRLTRFRAIRLLATTNLSLYATLMERHLSDGALAETELVVRLERDLDNLDDAQSGLIKSWASQGWLHRIVDGREGHDQNFCYLTQDARHALDFLRGMRRQDTIATGGSITGIASRLKQVALRVDNDPTRIRKHIDAEIAARHVELDQLDAGQRPQPDVTDCYDEARAIALQMERLITDIGQSRLPQFVGTFWGSAERLCW